MRANGDLRSAVVRAVIEEFRPRFIPQGRVVWVKDVRKRAVDISDFDFRALGLKRCPWIQLPNVVLYDKERHWLVLVDVPGIRDAIRPNRGEVLGRVFGYSGLEFLLVNAFKSRRDLRELLLEPPWGTAAWIANEPEHMIHFDGPHLLTGF